MIYLVVGVSGCGKSTVGSLLGERLGLPFYDADDFHSEENKNKMAQGVPLNDDDRMPWLKLLASKLQEWNRDGGAVLACSGLKQRYRDVLVADIPECYQFVYLKGDYEVIAERLAARQSHFMNPALLQSQFDTLEEPKDAWEIDINKPIEELVNDITERVRG